MRGTLTLFKDIFVDELPSPERLRKGRSEFHISRRNECLIDRYYYHAKTTGKRYDLVIKSISDEFFLSTDTIPDIIAANHSQLLLLKKQQPTRHYFEKKWPHLAW